MKPKLLLLIIFFSIASFSQAPITSYYPNSGTSYAVVTSSNTVDHSPSGANAVWNFNNLNQIGSSEEHSKTPTSAELISYPNTTTTRVNLSTLNATSLIFLSKDASNLVSITALNNPDIELNYITDNASLGIFPMNYGYSYTDNLAGTYNFKTYAGTFKGTITTTVDAYGTINLKITGSDPISQTVTRLKSVQNITLDYGVIANIGNVQQTTYSYYTTSISDAPAFRSSASTISIPMLSINQANTQMEKYLGALGVNEVTKSMNQIQIVPNPVEDVLNIKTNLKILSVSISDINGRVVMKSDYAQNYLDVSHLKKGVYFATIETDLGITIEKLLRK